MEAQVLDAVQYLSCFFIAKSPVEARSQVLQGIAVHQDVLESDPLCQYHVEDHPAQSGLRPFSVEVANLADLDGCVQIYQVRRVSDTGLVEVVECASGADAGFPDLGQVVAAHDHIEGGRHERVSGRGRQHVVGAEHYLFGFQHRHPGQWYVDRHLVAVEVRVKGGTDQRMDLDGVALDEHGHECLDAQPVQRGGAVEEHGAVFDHVFQDVPDLAPCPLNHALGILDVGRYAQDHQSVHDERLEQLQSHAFGQTALVHLEFGSHDDDRAPAVVHALPQQVLPETALLAAKQV